MTIKSKNIRLTYFAPKFSLVNLVPSGQSALHVKALFFLAVLFGVCLALIFFLTGLATQFEAFATIQQELVLNEYQTLVTHGVFNKHVYISDSNLGVCYSVEKPVTSIQINNLTLRLLPSIDK